MGRKTNIQKEDVLATKLPHLQNKMKRDPMSYKDEFMQQWHHLESSIAIFQLKPEGNYDEFEEQLSFISHVSSCYPKETAEFPNMIMKLLSEHYQIMSIGLRKTMVQCLILLRNKNVVSPTTCKDKALRALLHNHIVTDIKNLNAKSKNNKFNKTLQNFMYTMLNDSSEVAAKKSLQVIIELYKKNVWNDAKTVNVISEACFSKIGKIAATAIHFFVGADEEDEDDDSDEDVPDLTSMRHANKVNKKKKSRKLQMEKVKSLIRKKDRQKNSAESFNFSALHLLHDPQGFSEKLFSRLRQVSTKNIFPFPIRLQIMNLVSRLIGIHKLIILGFYDFVISYLKPHQKDVASILAFCAQASHELVPPDVMATVLRAIADNFVWSNCASEVITAGLNALREICTRCPLSMPEELLQSLLEDYKNHREKGPMNAARSLIGLYREFNPEMLRKKDRGKVATMNMKSFKAKQYGETEVLDTIEGLDLLDQEGNEEKEEGEDDDEAPELVENEENTASDVDNQVNSECDEEGSEDDDLEELDDEDLEEIELESDLESIEGEVIDSDGLEDLESDEEEVDQDEQPETEPSAEDITARKRKAHNLMATKILSDEDFARLREIQMEKEAERMMGVKKPRLSMDGEEDFSDRVDVGKIVAGTKKKNTYEERLESIKAGREGRTFGSRKGKENRGSTTNKEKAKKTKNFMMIVHKRAVVGKAKRSLRDKQKALRAHINKQKKHL